MADPRDARIAELEGKLAAAEAAQRTAEAAQQAAEAAQRAAEAAQQAAEEELRWVQYVRWERERAAMRTSTRPCALFAL